MQSGRVSPADAAKTLVAFANADGGTLLVGIHDGEVDGVSPARANDIRQAALDHTTPPVRTHVEELQLPDASARPRTVLVVRVGPGDHVHTLTNGQCLLRIGDESRRLGTAQHQEFLFDLELHHVLPPLLEVLGLVELEHKPRGNRVRSVQP